MSTVYHPSESGYGGKSPFLSYVSESFGERSSLRDMDLGDEISPLLRDINQLTDTVRNSNQQLCDISSATIDIKNALCNELCMLLAELFCAISAIVRSERNIQTKLGLLAFCYTIFFKSAESIAKPGIMHENHNYKKVMRLLQSANNDLVDFLDEREQEVQSYAAAKTLRNIQMQICLLHGKSFFLYDADIKEMLDGISA